MRRVPGDELDGDNFCSIFPSLAGELNFFYTDCGRNFPAHHLWYSTLIVRAWKSILQEMQIN